MAWRSFGDCSRGPFGGPIRRISSFFWGEKKTGAYLAFGAVVVVGTLKVISHIQSSNRRKRWNNVGKDKVVLHMFPRGRFCPNLSPFVVKLEMYLRMADIPYEVDYEEPMGAKGKAPWITLNGEEIADSQLIMEKLGSMYNKDFDGHLSAEQKAVATALRIMMEDHFLWCLAIWRYVVNDSKAFMEAMILPPIFKILMYSFKGRVKNLTYMQGMGRHSNQDVEEFGRKDLEVISTWLGEKPYFMGDKPSQIDCAMFGMLSQIEWNSSGSPYLQMIKGDFKNLSAYCYRIKEKYWPDWNQCLNPPQP